MNAGGTIGGNGILPSITINGGTLAPGNSIGTLTIQGNLVLTSAAAYIVEVSPTQADRTNVTGTATLAGTVQAVFAPGQLHRAHVHDPVGGGRTQRHLRQPHHVRPAGRLRGEPELHRDRRDLQSHRGARTATQHARGQQPLPNAP